jgi:GDP-L-fucose synthase
MTVRREFECPFRLAGRRVWVAGHGGMVGQALVKRLGKEGCEILTADRNAVDLRRQRETEAWIEANRPDVIFLAAAKVGGILANDTRPAEFLHDNLLIQTNVIDAAWRSGVQKLLALGSSCIYPREAPQPIRESALLTGPLEPTNMAYAIAKISGLMLCESYRRQYGADFIAAMPTNLYGPGDNFDLESSHVVPALLRKIDDAKLRGDSTVTIWGTGRPRREFLHVDDCADALVHLMTHYSAVEHINVGTGMDIAICDLAQLIAKVVGYEGDFVFDTTRPDGTLLKRLDVRRVNELGWKASIDLETGLRQTYDWYRPYRDAAVESRPAHNTARGST